MSMPRADTVKKSQPENNDLLVATQKELSAALPEYLGKDVLNKLLTIDLGSKGGSATTNLTYLYSASQLVCTCIANVLHQVIQKTGTNYMPVIDMKLATTFILPVNGNSYYESLVLSDFLAKFSKTTDPEVVVRSCQGIEADYKFYEVIDQRIRNEVYKIRAALARDYFNIMEGRPDIQTTFSDVLCLDSDKITSLKKSISSSSDAEVYEIIKEHICACLDVALYFYSVYKKQFPEIKLENPDSPVTQLIIKNKFDGELGDPAELPANIKNILNIGVFGQKLLMAAAASIIGTTRLQLQAASIESCLIYLNEFLSRFYKMEQNETLTRRTFAEVVSEAIRALDIKKKSLTTILPVLELVKRIEASGMPCDAINLQDSTVATSSSQLTEKQKKLLAEDFSKTISEFKKQFAQVASFFNALPAQCNNLISSLTELGEVNTRIYNSIQKRKIELDDLFSKFQQISNKNLKLSSENLEDKKRSLLALTAIIKICELIVADFMKTNNHCTALKNRKAKEAKKAKRAKKNAKQTARSISPDAVKADDNETVEEEKISQTQAVVEARPASTELTYSQPDSIETEVPAPVLASEQKPEVVEPVKKPEQPEPDVVEAVSQQELEPENVEPVAEIIDELPKSEVETSINDYDYEAHTDYLVHSMVENLLDDSYVEQEVIHVESDSLETPCDYLYSQVVYDVEPVQHEPQPQPIVYPPQVQFVFNPYTNSYRTFFNGYPTPPQPQPQFEDGFYYDNMSYRQ